MIHFFLETMSWSTYSSMLYAWKSNRPLSRVVKISREIVGWPFYANKTNAWPFCTWRIIPFSKWLGTMVIVSPLGYSPSKWPKWLFRGLLTVLTKWDDPPPVALDQYIQGNIQGFPRNSSLHMLPQLQEKFVCSTMQTTYLYPVVQGHASVLLLILGDTDTGWMSIKVSKNNNKLT